MGQSKDPNAAIGDVMVSGDIHIHHLLAAYISLYSSKHTSAMAGFDGTLLPQYFSNN